MNVSARAGHRLPKATTLIAVCTALALTTSLNGPAGATDLGLAAVASSIGVFGARVSLSDLPLGADLDLRGSAGLGNLSAALGLAGGFDLGPVGRLGVVAGLEWVFGYGARGEVTARGTLGPVAADLRLLGWTAAGTRANPQSAFTQDVDPLTSIGWLVSLGGSYRVTRTLVSTAALSASSLGSQLSAGLENRFGDWTVSGRLTGVTYPGYANEARLAAGAKFASQESAFQANAQAGMVVASQLSACLMPVSTVQAQAIAGCETLKVLPTVRLSFGAQLSDDVNATIFGVYEPLVVATNSTRFGLTVNAANVGPGALSFTAAGGLSEAGDIGFAGRVSYAFSF